MSEISKRIEELRKEISRINDEICELERKNSNFYIGVCEIGDGNYWDEYYRRLGFISEEEAKNWVKKQEEDGNVYTAKYFEVTKEIYDKYNDWYYLDRLHKAINRYNTAIRKLEGLDSFEQSVVEAIEVVAKEIGIEYLSFMHIERDEIYN